MSEKQYRSQFKGFCLDDLEYALSHDDILTPLIKGDKIPFIKAVRTLAATDPGLKEAKFADSCRMADRLWERHGINKRPTTYQDETREVRNWLAVAEDKLQDAEDIIARLERSLRGLTKEMEEEVIKNRVLESLILKMTG